MKRILFVAFAFWGVLLFAGCSSGKDKAAPAADLSKIRHIVIIMQENRSFDSYFGSYPGADGFPMQNGQTSVCVPDPESATCVRPYHDANDLNHGGPHSERDARNDVNGGGMDGFIRQERQGRRAACADPTDPSCVATELQPDVMGYHDAREIANYWTYANEFVLQDRMFEPNASWSLPAHLFTVSGWSALCTKKGDPMSCASALQAPVLPPDFLTRARRQPDGSVRRPDYAWTDITYLLHKAQVTWAYYVAEGTEPDCEDDEAVCLPKPQRASTPGIWNPLPWFTTVREDGELGNIKPLDRFYDAAKSGTLPARFRELQAASPAVRR
jgi:phospholipase C